MISTEAKRRRWPVELWMSATLCWALMLENSLDSTNSTAKQQQLVDDIEFDENFLD